jgi:hypothetical protein
MREWFWVALDEDGLTVNRVRSGRRYGYDERVDRGRKQRYRRMVRGCHLYGRIEWRILGNRDMDGQRWRSAY